MSENFDAPSPALQLAFQQAIRNLCMLPTSSVSSKKKLLLYGLHSYVTRGDLPPAKDLSVLMKDKVEMIKRKSWLTASKLSKTQAMEDYCRVVRELTTREPKCGHLFRQHAGGTWRKYNIELKDRLLSYSPHNSANGTGGGIVFLMHGCVVSLEQPQPPNSPYVAFSIAHPKSNKVFTVGAETMESAQEWIDAIRLECNDKRMDTNDSLLLSEPLPPTTSVFLKSNLFLPLRPSSEYGVPTLYAKRMDECAELFLRLTADPSQWTLSTVETADAGSSQFSTFLGREDKESSSGDWVGVLGHVTKVSAPARCVFDMVWSLKQRNVVDPQMEAYHVVEELGKQARVDHLTYSAVWPTSKRDFCRLVHYRIDEQTGSALVLACTIEHIMCPPCPQAVRADILCTGFLIEPLLGGTCCQVKYLIVVNPKVFSVPKRFVQSIGASQTSILQRMAKFLSTNEFVVQSALELGRMNKNPGIVALQQAGNEDAQPVRGTIRRRRKSTGMNSTAVFIKTEEITRRKVHAAAAEEEGLLHRTILVPMFVGIVLASISTMLLLLHALFLAYMFPFSTREATKRRFVGFTCTLPLNADSTVIALQRIISEDCSSLRGRFGRSGMWRGDEKSVILLMEMDSLVNGEGWLLASSSNSSNKSLQVGGDQPISKYNAVLVTGARVFDHAQFTDCPVLFSLLGDELYCSIDVRCSRDFTKFMERTCALSEVVK